MRCRSSFGEEPRNKFTSIGSSVSRPTRSSNQGMAKLSCLRSAPLMAGALKAQAGRDVRVGRRRFKRLEQEIAGWGAPRLGARAGGASSALGHEQFAEIATVKRNEHERLAGWVEMPRWGDG